LITAVMIVGGLALMVVSYFFLAAPWGTTAARYSNPRLQFAPALFVLGVMSLFGSAVVYELLPDRRKR
jgi:hypothetical protein